MMAAAAAVEHEIDPEALGRLDDAEILGVDPGGHGAVFGVALDERGRGDG